MALQVRELYIMVVNSDPVTHRLHDRFFPRGFIDIPPISECPEGVSVPARLFKRNCRKWWLWRQDHAPKPKDVDMADLSMRELREKAQEQGLTIKVGMSKADAVAMLKGETR